MNEAELKTQIEDFNNQIHDLVPTMVKRNRKKGLILLLLLGAGVINSGLLLFGTFNEYPLTDNIVGVLLYCLQLTLTTLLFKAILFPGTEEMEIDAMDELLPCNSKTAIGTRNIILQCAVKVYKKDMFKFEAQRNEFLTLTTQTLETVEKSGNVNNKQLINTFVDCVKMLNLKYQQS